MATSLLADLASALDAVAFARQLGLEPDPWQADVLRSPAPRVLLNCARQSGKSTVAALLAVHEALYAPASLVLCVSPSLRQSSELFRKCADVYRTLPQAVPADAESALRLELSNGSRILSLPGSETTARGFSAPRLILVDEAARVSDELYAAVRPMLAVSQGRLLALSTPFGRRGWWHDAWEHGTAWQRVRIPADQCPRISAQFLADERAALPRFVFDQEYHCLFAEGETSVFAYADIQAALSPDVAPLFRLPP
jgi:hypothetical protein